MLNAGTLQITFLAKLKQNGTKNHPIRIPFLSDDVSPTPPRGRPLVSPHSRLRAALQLRAHSPLAPVATVATPASAPEPKPPHHPLPLRPLPTAPTARHATLPGPVDHREVDEGVEQLGQEVQVPGGRERRDGVGQGHPRDRRRRRW